MWASQKQHALARAFRVVYSSVYAYVYVFVLLIGTVLKLTKPKPQ